MLFNTAIAAAILASAVSAATLNIPTRVGSKVVLSAPSAISGVKDMGNKEFDRGISCDSDEDTGSASAVFILEAGATLSNVIIGANALEGVHCKGACTLKNVWFRDVCEDAITLLGEGTVLISGGGANAAVDKVVQANGKGTTTITGYTVTGGGKLYRSCGNCSKNGGPRNIIVKDSKLFGITSDIVGINSNYGDIATISGSCSDSAKKVCQEFKGILKSAGGESPKLSTNANCQGPQGKLARLPAC